MDAFELIDLESRQTSIGAPWLEFLRSSQLSAGLYVLPVGAVDGQSPHTEDEVYIVMGGQATIRVGDEDRPVRAGSVVFVAAGVDHRFHDIAEDLSILVVFAPPEGSRG